MLSQLYEVDIIIPILQVSVDQEFSSEIHLETLHLKISLCCSHRIRTIHWPKVETL